MSKAGAEVELELGDEIMWLEEEDTGNATGGAPVEELNAEAKLQALQESLAKKELEMADVRKELAAKTVQLMRKEQALQQMELEKATAPARLLASGGGGSGGGSETERHLTLLSSQVQQLEMQLSQRTEELEEVKRLAASQKRALREAAAMQGDREAAEFAAVEASKVMVGQAVEEELERLAAELAATKTRSELEQKSREVEVLQLRQQLNTLASSTKQEVKAAEAAITEAWQAELDKQQAESQAKLSEYEGEVARLRQQLEDVRRHADSSSLISELAMLNNQKVQVQREFEAFKEMATQASRKNREEVARLLEENAGLHQRLAGMKTAELIGRSSKSQLGESSRSGDIMSQPTPSGYTAYAYQAAHRALEAYMPKLLARLEAQQRGLVPALVIGSVVLLVLLIAVIRAAASTRSQHSGPLCFLAKLGISIGRGCGEPIPSQTAAQNIAQILDRPQRHHDVDVAAIALPGVDVKPANGKTNTAAAAAADGAGGSGVLNSKEAASSDSESAAAAGSGSGQQINRTEKKEADSKAQAGSAPGKALRKMLSHVLTRQTAQLVL